jgi:hypothetical protein
MASNGDHSASFWASVVNLGRAWSLSLTFYWQKTDEAAAPSFSPERVGESLAIELFPSGTSGPSYEGTALIQSVSVPGDIGPAITQTVNLAGDGPLYFGIAPTITGAVPAEELLSVVGEVENVDASTWFAGEGLSYSASALPPGLSIDTITGLITGTPTAEAVPLFVTVTAANPLGQASTSFDWATWDARADAKGWYDTTPSTLKTDLVASFDRLNNEYLSITDADQSGLNFAGEFTVAGWINTTGLTSNNCIVSKWSSGGFRLLQISTGQFRFYAADSGGVFRLVASSTVYTTSSGWLFVVAGYDGTNIFLTVNDQATPNTYTFTGPVTTGGARVEVGKNGSTYNDGQLADVACWSRTLSASEITALYNSGTPRHYADLSTSEKVGLVSFWNLWEPRGTRYDSHGTNHLTDNNTVGAAQGPVEIQAGEYAGVTKWENQGTDASPFGDVAINAPGDAPQFIGGVLVYDALSNALQTTSGETLGDSTIVFVGSKDAAAPSGAYVMDSNDASFRRLLYVPSGKYRAYSNALFSASTNTTTDRVLVFASFTSTDVTLQVDADVFAKRTGTTEAMKGLSVGGINSLHSGFNWVGTIESVIVFGRLLTATEKAALTAHFALA